MMFAYRTLAAALAISACIVAAGSGAMSETLSGPENFSPIASEEERSQALFTELGKVLTSPRCLNCHPAGDRPRQGDNQRLHQPPVFRGADGLGLETMRCPICHQSANFDPARMPGHTGWRLAPREMAWHGKTLAEICSQIKDPQHNGDRSLADLVDHIGEDGLVGWAWEPGQGRRPAPGTQEVAGALVQAWIDTGAACPD